MNEGFSALRVFVYGTLKPGGRYHQALCQNDLSAAQPAFVRGRLYDFPQLGYPAIAPGSDWVKGYVLIFEQSPAVCADVLSRLDRLEGYRADRADEENDYRRLRVQPFFPMGTPLALAWMYQMSAAQVFNYEGVIFT